MNNPKGGLNNFTSWSQKVNRNVTNSSSSSKPENVFEYNSYNSTVYPKRGQEVRKEIPASVTTMSTHQGLTLLELQNKIIASRQENVKLKQFLIQKQNQKKSEVESHYQRQKQVDLNLAQAQQFLSRQDMSDELSSPLYPPLPDKLAEKNKSNHSLKESVNIQPQNNTNRVNSPHSINNYIKSEMESMEAQSVDIDRMSNRSKTPQVRKNRNRNKVEDENITNELKNFANLMNKVVIDENSSNNTMMTSTENNKDVEEKLLMEEKRKRKEARENVASFLEAKSFNKMPLWRHKLLGINDPPVEQILKGKALFRLLVRIVLDLYVKPFMLVRKKRLDRKVFDSSDMSKKLLLFMDGCDGWLAKAVRTPLLSVLQVCIFVHVC